MQFLGKKYIFNGKIEDFWMTKWNFCKKKGYLELKNGGFRDKNILFESKNVVLYRKFEFLNSKNPIFELKMHFLWLK